MRNNTALYSIMILTLLIILSVTSSTAETSINLNTGDSDANIHVDVNSDSESEIIINGTQYDGPSVDLEITQEPSGESNAVAKQSVQVSNSGEASSSLKVHSNLHVNSQNLLEIETASDADTILTNQEEKGVSDEDVENSEVIPHPNLVNKIAAAVLEPLATVISNLTDCLTTFFENLRNMP